jgi:hypothetical protein
MKNYLQDVFLDTRSRRTQAQVCGAYFLSSTVGETCFT